MCAHRRNSYILLCKVLQSLYLCKIYIVLETWLQIVEIYIYSYVIYCRLLHKLIDYLFKSRHPEANRTQRRVTIIIVEIQGRVCRLAIARCLSEKCMSTSTLLKGQQQYMFLLEFFSWIYSTWGPDFEAEGISTFVSYSQSYLNFSRVPCCSLQRRL